MIKKITNYIERLLKENPCFTGSIEINYKDGVLMDIVKRERKKAVEL